jgi:hypothetical protein
MRFSGLVFGFSSLSSTLVSLRFFVLCADNLCEQALLCALLRCAAVGAVAVRAVGPFRRVRGQALLSLAPPVWVSLTRVALEYLNVNLRSIRRKEKRHTHPAKPKTPTQHSAMHSTPAAPTPVTTTSTPQQIILQLYSPSRPRFSLLASILKFRISYFTTTPKN